MKIKHAKTAKKAAVVEITIIDVGDSPTGLTVQTQSGDKAIMGKGDTATIIMDDYGILTITKVNSPTIRIV